MPSNQHVHQLLALLGGERIAERDHVVRRATRDLDIPAPFPESISRT